MWVFQAVCQLKLPGLLHHYAPGHMALSVQHFVIENVVFLYPTYSLNQVPCAFFLLPKI
jgi:hypothetical protein